MRIVVLDYLVAGILALTMSGMGFSVAQRIVNEQTARRSSDEDGFGFSLGTQRYRIYSSEKCVGELEVRAVKDSVIAFLARGSVNLRRGRATIASTATASLAFNPLQQLYDGSLTINAGDLNVGTVKIKNVRPHELSITGFSIPKDAPIQFAVPGPVTLRQRDNSNYYLLQAPDELALPNGGSVIASALRALNLVLRTSEASEKNTKEHCSFENAIDLEQIESTLKSSMTIPVSH